MTNTRFLAGGLLAGVALSCSFAFAVAPDGPTVEEVPPTHLEVGDITPLPAPLPLEEEVVEVTPPTPEVEVVAPVEPAPLPAGCGEGMIMAEDGSCVPLSYYEEPSEDDPAFDCRAHGNHLCGVEVEGHWYVLDFDTMTFSLR